MDDIRDMDTTGEMEPERPAEEEGSELGSKGGMLVPPGPEADVSDATPISDIHERAADTSLSGTAGITDVEDIGDTSDIGRKGGAAEDVDPTEGLNPGDFGPAGDIYLDEGPFKESGRLGGTRVPDDSVTGQGNVPGPIQGVGGEDITAIEFPEGRERTTSEPNVEKEFSGD